VVSKQIAKSTEPMLLIDYATLQEAGLLGRVRLIVKQGEIRIIPEDTLSSEERLESLAGCLGEEEAGSYDYSLDIGGLYEAR
jgi:hypothetical protein